MSARPISVLVVEDERIVATDLQQTLTEQGYDAFAIASSAEEAIARSSERCPDVVLMDIRIKGKLDGIETAKLLQERFRVPVIYLTAHSDDATLVRAKQVVPHAYLLKPVRTSELRSAVEIAVYRHQMEKQLRARERWFSTTLRSLTDAVLTVDLQSHVTFMNPAAELLTGTAAEASLGRPVREVLERLDSASSATPLWSMLRDGRDRERREGQLVNAKTGNLHVVDEIAAPVVDDAETLGTVMVFRDVTEQKRLQTQLEFADRLASLGTMAAGIAHEVNNPLATVVANAGFVASELEALQRHEKLECNGPELRGPSDEVVQAITDLRSAATRIGRIVSDLKTFSRPPPPSSASMDLANCLEWALRTMSHEFRHRARVVTKIDTLPFVEADEGRIGQVLINLLVNAAQAIPPGKIEENEVRVSAHAHPPHGVVIEIADTGVGIPPDALKRIFEPFFTTKPVGLGTGLGLSICHGILHSVGGSIEVTSQIGKGTTVRVLLRASSAIPSIGMSELEPSGRNFVRGKLLIVDDEILVRRAITRVLRRHDLTCVEDGRTALAILREQRFDLVLCDLMMPTVTGIDVYEALLVDEPEIAKTLVFMTGDTVTPRVEAFLGSIDNARFHKPFENEELRELVQSLLVKHDAPH